MKYKNYIDYYKDNPKGYWFKRKIYGWGWVPVKLQGWIVLFISIAFFILGIYIGDTDDSPGAAFLGFVIMAGIILFFCIKKGEKPKWQWGLKK